MVGLMIMKLRAIVLENETRIMAGRVSIEKVEWLELRWMDYQLE